MNARGDNNDRRRRAEARQHWPVRIYKLGEEPGDDLSDCTTAEERLAMVWELTQQAWRLSGKHMPTYSRGEIPIRVIQRKLPAGE